MDDPDARRSDRKRARRAKDVRLFGIGMLSSSIGLALITGGPNEGNVATALIGIALIIASFIFWRPKHWTEV